MHDIEECSAELHRLVREANARNRHIAELEEQLEHHAVILHISEHGGVTTFTHCDRDDCRAACRVLGIAPKVTPKEARNG